MSKLRYDDLFEYWKDKAITRDGRVITEYGYPGYDENEFKNIEDTIPVIEDWCDPCCFACNTFLINQEDLDVLDLEPVKVWGNDGGWIHNAERAHIYPRSKGGSKRPDNIFFLCRRCHLESPDSEYPNEFFRWVYKRRKMGGVGLMAIEECANREILPLFCVDDLEKVGTHGTYVTTSSEVAALVGASEERNKVMPKLGNGLDGKMFSNIYKFKKEAEQSDSNQRQSQGITAS